MKYLYLDSEDSKDSHPQNKPFDFTVEMPTPLELEGNWSCALAEIYFTREALTQDLYVYCDLCDYNYVNQQYSPILRIINSGDEIFDKCFYVPLVNKLISRIRIYIKTKSGEKPSVSIQKLRCTLQLKHGK
jgi:hypothetical protein